MALAVYYPDGTSEQRALALDKATTVFHAAGIDPLGAFIALGQRETWDNYGFDDAHALTEDQEVALRVLAEAEGAAYDALGLSKDAFEWPLELIYVSRWTCRDRARS
jgi:hypothetical protein